jgi:CHAT domain-containing protein
MTSFYQTLLQGNDTSFADGLKDAKLNLIAKEKYAAPYYWAPFILIGF